MCIWIYKDINGTQDKRNYDDKVPVQIKGHVDKNRKYIDEQKITYFVDLDDLEVYFQDRGVLFFEVFMTEDGKDREVSVKESRGQPINGTLKQAIIG